MSEWKHYFEEYGNTVIAERGWGWDDLTVEKMYQMFKERMKDENK